MPTRLPIAAALWLVASPAGATLIDSYESGSFSHTLTGPGSAYETQTPSFGHCIAAQRDVGLFYDDDSTGPLTAELIPQQNVDDALVATFPTGSGSWGAGAVEVGYHAPGTTWDLTNGGSDNRISVRVSGGGNHCTLQVTIRDWDGNSASRDVAVTIGATYHFDLGAFWNVDETKIEQIGIVVYGSDGESVGIQNVETTSGSTLALRYQAWTPQLMTIQCGPMRGGPAIGWSWDLGLPGAPPMAGPRLAVEGLGGVNCASVEFLAESSGPPGGFGEVGLVTVDWNGGDFGSAIFSLNLTTDPNAGYVAQLVSGPEFVDFEDGFLLWQEIHIADAQGLPDGTARQEVIVTPVEGQQLTLESIIADPYTADGVGCTMTFEYGGVVYDPANPLFEIYTTARFTDDAGVTGVNVGAAAEPSDRRLTARPTITRGGTRFVIEGAGPEPAQLAIFDVTGRLVRELEFRNGEASWNGAGANGRRVPAGVYFGRVGGAKAARVVMIR